MGQWLSVSGSYVFDSGRSSALQDALHPLVSAMRAELRADVGLVLYRADSGRHFTRTLTASADDADLPLLNEPLRVCPSITSRRPLVLNDVELVSVIRNYRLRLRSAVTVSWRDAYGSGSLLIGNTAGEPVPAVLSRSLAQRTGRHLNAAVNQGRKVGSACLRHDLDKALADVARATVEAEDAGAALAVILGSARELLGSDVAYMALPGPDERTYNFDYMLGIRTPAFRRLSMGFDQGLGGLARSARKTVRSFDYARDDRLQDAPVQETLAEGIRSAMAAPLLVEDEVRGALYIGNRHLRPFTRTDEALLTEFSGYASLGLRRRSLDDHRSRMLERQAAERLAVELHDTVVRGLLEIGFEAEQLGRTVVDASVRHRMTAIGQTAEDCLSLLRDQLSQLSLAHRAQPVTAAEVLERVCATRGTAGVMRTSRQRGEDDLLAPRVGEALVRIGQEALANSGRHSDCRHQRVEIESSAATVTLTVRDDGRGLAASALDDVLSESSPHLGFRLMRAAAAGVGGRLLVEQQGEGGLTVRAVLPRYP